MPNLPPVPPCADCRSDSDQLAVIATLLNNASGNATPSQARVTVAGSNQPVLAQGTYQVVHIKNTGTAVVWIRTASGAATGANGEIPIAGGSAAGDGLGGVLTLTNFTGVITGACGTSSTLSVTWAT